MLTRWEESLYAVRGETGVLFWVTAQCNFRNVLSQNIFFASASPSKVQIAVYLYQGMRGGLGTRTAPQIHAPSLRVFSCITFHCAFFHARRYVVLLLCNTHKCGYYCCLRGTPVFVPVE